MSPEAVIDSAKYLDYDENLVFWALSKQEDTWTVDNTLSMNFQGGGLTMHNIVYVQYYKSYD